MRKGVHDALQEKTTAADVRSGRRGPSSRPGRVREALQELERQAALAPQKALPRSRVARAAARRAAWARRRSGGPEGHAARAEARRGLAHARLGAATRRARPPPAARLRPHRRPRRLSQGPRARSQGGHHPRRPPRHLLEYDARGRRYSPQADLPAAIAEYQALAPKDLNDHNMDDNLLVALVRSNRFEEARSLAAEMKDSQTGAVLALVATAATQGPRGPRWRKASAPVHRREGARPPPSSRPVRTFFWCGAMPMPPSSSIAPPPVGPTPAALLSLADLVRRARRHEEIQLPPDQPSTVFKRLLLALFTGDLETVKPGAYFSRDVQAELAREKGSDQLIRRMFSQMRDSMAGDVPPDAALDLGLTALRETVAGDDEIGYRINFTSSMGENSRQFAVYVVKEGGEYRLVGANAFHRVAGPRGSPPPQPRRSPRRPQMARLGRRGLPRAGARQWRSAAGPSPSRCSGPGARRGAPRRCDAPPPPCSAATASRLLPSSPPAARRRPSRRAATRSTSPSPCLSGSEPSAGDGEGVPPSADGPPGLGARRSRPYLGAHRSRSLGRGPHSG